MAEFLQDNWVYFALAAYGALSECLPFLKRIESNGILHFLYLFVGRLLKGKAPKTLVLIPLLLMLGCSTVSYKVTKPDGVVCEASYTRLLGETDGFKAKVCDSEVTAKRSSSETELIEALLRALVKVP